LALMDIGGRQAEVVLPEAKSMYEIFVPQIMAEAHFVHTTLLGTWPGESATYGSDVAARLRASESVTLGDYLEARDESKAIRSSFRRIFETVDVLVNVVGASGPSTVSDADHVLVGNRRVTLLDAMMPSTLPQNLAGLPSLTVPAGTDREGLPIGVQLSARPWSEPLLLELGRRLEASGAVSVVS
jgi:aspartyl-tRNA(Asn)/glutamyl-tRNA(Gln) amidotransferase subunit A